MLDELYSLWKGPWAERRLRLIPDAGMKNSFCFSAGLREPANSKIQQHGRWQGITQQHHNWIRLCTYPLEFL